MLLPHNQSVYDDIKTAYENHQDVLVIHGTGMGKSFLFLELCRTTFSGKKILFVVPKHATKAGGIESYCEYDESGADVTFVTYNWFRDNNRIINAVIKYDVIVFDEAHHLGSDRYGANALKTFELVRSSGDKYILGLTATNKREDGTDVSGFFSETVNGCTIFQGIRQGIIPSFEYLVCRDNEDETAGYDKNVKDYRKKLDIEGSLPILRDVIRDNPRKRWLVFFSNIQSLDENERTVRDAFPRGYAFLKITSYHDTPMSQIEEYENTVVLCVDKLLEGVHVKDTTGIILFRNIRSLPVFQQVLGRVVHVGGTEHPIVIDCTQTALKMLAKLLKENGGGHIQDNDISGLKPILYCSLQNTERFNIARLLALAEYNQENNWTEEELQILKEKYGTMTNRQLCSLLPEHTPQSIQAKAAALQLSSPLAGQEWTEEDDNVLRQQVKDGFSAKEIGETLHRTENSIKNRMSKLGLKSEKWWSEDEIVYVKENYGKMPTRDIADHLGRSLASVKNAAIKYGVQGQKKTVWTDEMIEILTEYYKTVSRETLSKMLCGVSPEAISSKAHDLGLKKRVTFTLEKDEQLKKYYDTKTKKELADMFGVTAAAVAKRAGELGLTQQKHVWTKEKLDYLIDNYSKMTKNELSEELGINSNTIAVKARRLGLSKRAGA